MTAASPPSGVVEQAERLRRRLAAGGPLADARIGTVPILWNNADLPELRHGAGADVVLDDIARTGYEGTQLGINFPEGDALKGILAARDLRLAEVYTWFEATVDGPAEGSLELVRERIRILRSGGGEVLVIAFDGTPDRDAHAGRATAAGTPRLTDDGWRRTVELLTVASAETRAVGARIAFHPHAGTFVETPDEVDRLMSSIPADVLPLCLDVGHYTVGGGDPLEALRTYGERVTHLHLKDVDPEILAGLRDGSVAGFGEGLRRRLFTELGAGVLDLNAILAILAERRYDGWLMVEQDSSWPPPSESAAIGRRVLAAALRRVSGAATVG